MLRTNNFLSCSVSISLRWRNYVVSVKYVFNLLSYLFKMIKKMAWKIHKGKTFLRIIILNVY